MVFTPVLIANPAGMSNIKIRIARKLEQVRKNIRIDALPDLKKNN
jgi:hypothetical protein